MDGIHTGWMEYILDGWSWYEQNSLEILEISPPVNPSCENSAVK